MAVRNPSSIDLTYSEKDFRKRQPILSNHYDIAWDNQAFILRRPKLMLSTCFLPRQSNGSTEVFRTSLYSKHKCGASFGGGTIGRVAVLTYESDNSFTPAVPTSGSFDVVLSDGVNSDTTTFSYPAFSDRTNPTWRLLTISNVVTASDDRSTRTDLTITINNFVSNVSYVYLCGVYILNND